jgi:D-alanyl-lipoteichoic acid acyltransferase DltB (MBOAT superfamily)
VLFNSYEFWTFLIIVLALYQVLPPRGQNRMLLVASYVFYGFWDWRFLGLIVGSTIVDFAAAQGMQGASSRRQRRAFLLGSLIANLGILGIFKYYGFFAHELNALLGSLGTGAPIPLLDVILPVGISFYTFQTLSYTIDVYRGQTRPTRDFLDFALYVAFFPQLVAGPIERSRHLLPQVVGERRRTLRDFRIGLYYVSLGLFLKVAIADNMAPLVDLVFQADAAELRGGECITAVYAFAFQIYGDFAGYSAIAKGVARWLGFDIMTNFARPYFATSPRDFWRRWHISLSTWLRDYLYVPLGGNRGSQLATLQNLMITMLLGGLWHGAAWTFVFWGLFHGLLLSAHRWFTERRGPRPALSGWRRWLAVLLTFHLVMFGWLLFRAESMQQVGAMLGAIAAGVEWTPLAVSTLALIVFFLGPLLLYEVWEERRGGEHAILEGHWLVQALVIIYFVAMVFFFPSPEAHEFIYFQF